MPEETQTTESLGWRAGLPDTLKTNEAFANYKTVGEFAQSHLELSQKAKDLEGKLGNSIPKLGDNATDEQRAQFYDALGRPKQSSEYEFDGEDKNAPEWNEYWKKFSHDNGFTKAQAKALSVASNGIFSKMTAEYNTKRQTEMAEAETKLKSEMGDKFDTNVELAKRMHQKHLGTEFDKDFAEVPPAARFGMVRLLLKVAALTGEDRSPTGGQNFGTKPNGHLIAYDKSPAPPKRV